MEVREPNTRYLALSPQKRTELGLLPTDWQVVRLSDIATVTSGKRLPLGESLFTSETPHPYIRVSDMRDGTVDPSAIQFVPVEVFPKIQQYRIFSTDLYISVAGTLGLVGQIPVSLDGANLTENANRISGIRGSKAYLYQVLASPLVQTVIESERTVGAQPKLALGRIRNFTIPLPPTSEEQLAIGSALSDTDALIDSLEQLLTKKRQIKQGAMQELLTGKRRLPGFNGPWVVREFRKLGHVIRGVAYNPDADLSDGDTDQTVRLLRSNNVQSGEVVRVGLQFVNLRRVRSDQYLQDGDLLVCMANGSRELVGKAGRFAHSDEHHYTFGAFMSCFRPDSIAVAPDFVAFLFQTHAFRQHVELLLAGSSINNLHPEGLLGFAASIPTEPTEQIALAQTLTDMNAELVALESRLTKARHLKQAMAQALLTGRIRLT